MIAPRLLNIFLLMFSGLLGLGLHHWAQGWREQERQRLKEQAANERQRFLKRLDHELKNPLTAMQIGLANLAESQDDPAAQQQAHESIQTQISRVSRLIHSLRKLAELEIGSRESIPLDMGALLHEVLTAISDHPAATERKICLELPNYPLPRIYGDPDLLQLAIYNLLDNAIKFSHNGDKICLRAYQDGGSLLIQVEDHGEGITAEDLPHVWEELYRSRRAHGIVGSGIGLALVKAIIDQHGGTVCLHSVYGEGTSVKLALPLLPPS